MLDSTIHWINHYPVGKYMGNQETTIMPMGSAIHLLNNWGQMKKKKTKTKKERKGKKRLKVSLTLNTIQNEGEFLAL